MTDLAWNMALLVPELDLALDERAAGWPDTFSLENVARLQYPAENDARRRALLNTLRAATGAGKLPATERTRECLVTPPFRRAVRSHYIHPESAGLRAPTRPAPRRVEVRELHIHRAALAAFLAQERVEQSEHIRAWLRPLEQAEARQNQTGPKRGRKPSKARGHMTRILDALEEFALARDESFDRMAMPGPHGETFEDEGSFHWACAQLFREFRCSNSNFRNRQHNGLCAVREYAKPTDFYRRALPVIAQKLGVSLNVRHLPSRTKKTA